MRHHIRVLYLIFLSALQSRAADNVSSWLVGSWKSNRDLTVASVHLDHELPTDKRARFENLFGQMTATYTPTEATFFMPAIEKYPEWTSTESYRVVAVVGKRIVIRHKNPRTKVEESSIMYFESHDRYWVDLTSTKGVASGREYFDRIPGDGR